MADLLQDARKARIAQIQSANAAKATGSVISPVKTVTSSDTLGQQREAIQSARQEAASKGLTSGTQNVYEKLKTGDTAAIQGVNPDIVAKARAALGTDAPTDTTAVGAVGTETSSTLAPLFGDTAPTAELGPTFNREYFDPLALYTERASQEQLDQLAKYKTEQQGLTAEEAAARDAALESRRTSAEQQRSAERNVAGLEEQSLLRQIDQGKRASFNQLRGQLSQMGAYGTTGTGALDFAVLGEIYNGKALDTRVAANKGLRDIEVAYWQIRDSIESDQSKSDIQRSQELQDLSSKVQTEWQSIQSKKQETITKLAKEAYDYGAEEQKRVRDQAAELVKTAVASGQPISDSLLQEAGYGPTQINIAKDIMSKASDATNAAQRLDWIESTIMPDFTVDKTALTEAASLLNIPFAELLAEAERWANAGKWEYQQKLKKTGSGSGGDEWLKGYEYIDEKTKELRIVYQKKNDPSAVLVTDDRGNQINTPKSSVTVPSGTGSALGSVLGPIGGLIGGYLGGAQAQTGSIQLQKVATAKPDEEPNTDELVVNPWGG